MNKVVKLGVIMDPIEHIKIAKDTTFAMMLAAQKRQWQLYYMAPRDIFWSGGEVYAHSSLITVFDNDQRWFQKESPQLISLNDLDIILMRQDPPVNMEYLYLTYLLEQVATQGVLVVNHPQAVRDANEKLFTLWFPECMPPTLITQDSNLIRQFFDEHQDIILKPLDGMAGRSVFRLQSSSDNFNVIIDTLTQNGQQRIMVQRYLPEVRAGDKRILLINGEPIPYALARIPQENEHRANLAAGGHGVGVPLTERDYWLCQQIGPTLKQKGLWFVGLDVIGDYVTEINVTSPTCVRELDRLYDLDIAGKLMDTLWHTLCKTPL